MSNHLLKQETAPLAAVMLLSAPGLASAQGRLPRQPSVYQPMNRPFVT